MRDTVLATASLTHRPSGATSRSTGAFSPVTVATTSPVAGSSRRTAPDTEAGDADASSLAIHTAPFATAILDGFWSIGIAVPTTLLVERSIRETVLSVQFVTQMTRSVTPILP